MSARKSERLMNLLILPADLMSDGAFLTAVAEVMGNAEAYPLPERVGPTRAELLAALGADELAAQPPADEDRPAVDAAS